MADRLFTRFTDYISSHALVVPGDKVLLAVSGGVDSMVMLHLFSRFGTPYGVAHCNFHLRGEEGDEDAVSVQQAAEALGVEHFNRDFDTQGEVEVTGESIEMAARRLRYAWFKELCEEFGYTKIVIAHHNDDSIETFFINLIRGTGLRGLTGIHATNGNIVRPLLFATRREILEYAHANNVSFREDSSNLSKKYIRNKIRLGVIPRIREIAPQFGTTMTENVERLTNALRFIDTQMEGIRGRITRTEGDATVIDVEAIDPVLSRDYVVYEMLRPYGFNADVVEDLLQSLDAGKSGTRFFSPTHIAYLNRRRIILKDIREEENYRFTVEESDPRAYGPGGVLLFETLEREDVESLRQPEEVALLDAAKIAYPLTVRVWQEGDSFIPLGMEGHKKISDFLIDEKVALPDKERQLVIVSGGDIVWLVGWRIDERYKVTEQTKHVLRISRQECDDNLSI
ncbi:MAG: tRNA lysidine(34) synthetase TilS [Rikenellaceae bacterium]|jgi:tRNA(Ile)-lysidine synthase|nr:tRNA lysidine(34) synthetase TilS [Rikenellaceae bacterium]